MTNSLLQYSIGIGGRIGLASAALVQTPGYPEAQRPYKYGWVSEHLSDESSYPSTQLDVKAIPRMITVHRDGRIAAIQVGYGESEIPMLVDEINSLWASGSSP